MKEQTLTVGDKGAFLAIDGRCHYWSLGPGTGEQAVWQETHFGVLTAQDDQDISRRMHYGDWSRLVGNWPGQGGKFDYPNMRFWNGSDVIDCLADCDADSNPQAVKDLSPALNDLLPILWKKGDWVDGPLRILVMSENQAGTFNIGGLSLANGTVISWPLQSVKVEDIAIPFGDPRLSVHGIGTLVSDPQDVRILRNLWKEFRDGHHGRWRDLRFIPVRRADQGPGPAEFALYAADSVPFENENGLIPPF